MLERKSGASHDTKGLVFSAVLLGIGFILHSISPPLFFSVKPDFLLACLFVAIFMFPTPKNALVTGMVAGIISALTTNFPGGQIPSIIDKISTALLILIFVSIFLKLKSNFKNTGILLYSFSFLATAFSGTMFLGCALLLFPLPAPFSLLFGTVVLPTAILNGFLAVFMYNLLNSLKSKL